MNVVVLGASKNEDRYSNMAVKRLKEKGYNVLPVHKAIKEIHGLPVYNDLSDIKDKVDTITVYVNESVSSSLASDILDLKPRRIIFNPGAENYDLKDKAEEQGIVVIFACTLVMLSTGMF
ncbi:MAG: CoA-binding protein [bacterium]